MSDVTINDAPVAPVHQCGRCRLHFPILPGTDPAELADWWLCAACHEALVPGQTRSRQPDQPAVKAERSTPPISG